MKLEAVQKAIAENDLRTLGRLISCAENQEDFLYSVLRDLYSQLGKARTIGFTGPPGAGKSTLINHYVSYLRARKEKVGVVAVDPVSPFTGGALLGDRIRLVEHFNDPDVFIRSLSTRGKLGGLSLATRQVLHLLDLFRFPNVLVETVGVGQSEVDIRHTAEISLVVLVPEWGDSVQALKSGLLEIGDVFIVHKGDREGADRVANELQIMLQMNGREAKPVFITSTDRPASLEKVWQAIDQRFTDSASWRPQRQNENRGQELLELIQSYVFREGSRWLKSQATPAGNPYQHLLEFLKRHPADSLFGK